MSLKINPERRPEYSVARRKGTGFTIAIGLLVSAIVTIAALSVFLIGWNVTRLGWSEKEPNLSDNDRSKNVCKSKASPQIGYAAVLAKLSCSQDSDIKRFARLVDESTCNLPATVELILRLNTAYQFSDTRFVGERFLARCGTSYDVAFPTVYALYQDSKFEPALDLLTAYEATESDGAQYVTWKAFVLEKLERVSEAASLFQRALFLFPSAKDVGFTQFDYAYRALKAAGRYCEAAAVLMLYINFDPQERAHPGLEANIDDLERQGNCLPDARPGPVTARLRLDGGLLLVDVKINDVPAVLLLDTGASTVHVTKSFAQKANIPLDPKNMVINQGITGSRRDFLATIESLALKQVRAKDVIVTVASDDASLGKGVDGLLGQTFLSRYTIRIDSSARTLMVDRRHY